MPTTVIRRNEHIIAAALAEETILLNAENWTYVQFNETAVRIWECLDEPRRLEDIVTDLLAEYAVEKPTCLRQVQEFAREMSGRGFIIVEEG
jgi:hypothetical protein